MSNNITIFKDYGNIKFNIKSLMIEQNISVTQMSKKTGLDNRVIQRYYDGEIERCDIDVLSKFCFILGCDLNDIMYYEKPVNT